MITPAPHRSKQTSPKIAWDAVRRDYETLPIGLRALTRRHGIRSDNQIRRRRDKEGWRRNVAGIAAERRRLMAAAEAEAPADATTSEALAQLQGRVLKQQLATAEALRRVAGPLKEHLLAILDDQDDALAQEAIRRLGLLGKQESLGTLLQFVARLTRVWASIEQGALGLGNLPRGHVVQGPPSDAKASPLKPEDCPELAEVIWRIARRRAYETTPTSLRRVAAEWGKRSDNSVRRVVVKKGWRRGGPELIEHLTPSPVAVSDRPPLAARGPAPSFPWAVIREAYGTDPVSVRRLAVRFGVSESRIRARCKREGWTSAPKVVIERHLRRIGRPALGAIMDLRKPEPDTASVRTAHTPGIRDTEQNGGRPPLSGEGGQPDPRKSAIPPSPSSVRSGSAPGHSTEPDPAEAQRRKRLTEARLSQLSCAAALRDIGVRLLGLVRTVLTEVDEQKVMQAKVLLTLLGGQGDLASVLRVATGQIMAGVAMENEAVELVW